MQAASIPPWIWLAGGIALGALVGFFVGYAIGVGRRAFLPAPRPILVMPKVTEAPLILEVENCRPLTNNYRDELVRDTEGDRYDRTIPDQEKQDDALLCLRSSRSGGVAG